MWCKRTGDQPPRNFTKGYVEESSLHAFVDDMLAPRRRLEVEEYLAERPREAARIRDFLAQNQAFHNAYDRILGVPLPAETELLEYRLLKTISRQHRWRRVRWIAASAAASLMVFATGASLGWPDPAKIFDTGIFEAMPDQSTSGVPAIRTVKMQASSASPSTSISSGAPDLRRFGYALVDTRRIPANAAEKAVQYSFESKTGRRIMFYLSRRPDQERRQLSLIQNGTISMMSWSTTGHSYVLIGEIDGEHLMEIGRTLQGADALSASR